MADTPPTPRAPASVKGFGAKLKGLPPWAYVAAIGVGGAAIWFGINRSQTQAENEAADVTGDYSSALSPSDAGTAFPSGSQGAGYYFDPTTGTTDLERSGEYFTQFSELLATIIPLVGGGTQSSARPEDHYVPPTIQVNIPESAQPQPQVQAPPPPPPPPPKPPDNCKGEFPFTQDSGPRKGQCYKYVKKDGKGYRYYKNGDKICVDNCR